MLAWMLYATALAAVLSLAAVLAERAVARMAATRLLWAVAISASVAWAVLTVTGGAAITRGPPRSGSADRQLPTHAATPTTPGDPSVSHDATRATHRADGPGGGGLDLLLLGVWIIGSCGCLMVLTLSAWRIERMRRSWREQVVAGVPVLLSHDVGPAVVGLVHHCIVVPAWVETLDEWKQQIVMTHEREHVRAGDPLLLWGATLLVSLMPWNVPLWFALRRLRHGIELDCDARVLRSRSSAREYCELLLDVGERTLAGVAPIAALAEPATLLERRIDAMLRTHTLGWRAGSGAAVGAALIAMACYAPKPVLTPQARVLAAVSELRTLLATDAGRNAITDEDRAKLEQALHAAADSAAIDRNEYGVRTDSLGRLRYPEAFAPHDDACIVGAIYSADGTLVKTFMKRVPLTSAFDVSHFHGVQTLRMRDSKMLVELATDEELVQMRQTGSQTMADVPHTVIVYAVLME